MLKQGKDYARERAKREGLDPELSDFLQKGVDKGKTTVEQRDEVLETRVFDVERYFAGVESSDCVLLARTKDLNELGGDGARRAAALFFRESARRLRNEWNERVSNSVRLRSEIVESRSEKKALAMKTQRVRIVPET